MINTILRKYFFLTLFCIISLFSCTDSDSVQLLKQANEYAENDPKQALAILNSIQTPESLSKDHYMQYIVSKVHVKYKNYEDITSDTLIFGAQEYFDANSNIEQAKLAHFYAGCVYYEQQKTDKALECYLKAELFAKKERDNLFLGKIQNNIGYIYFEQSVYDTAIDRFQKALDYYNKEKDTDIYKLQAILSIATTYLNGKNIDSTYIYYSKGFEFAEQIDNKEYQATFKHKLGLINREMGNYKQSLTYLNDALTQTTQSEDSLRVYLSLARLYNTTNQLDSAKFYTDIMKHRLSEITYNNTLRDMYSALYEYNKQCRNYEKAIHYLDLRSELSEKIIESNSADKLVGANIQFLKYSDKKEAEIFWKNFAIIVILIVATIFFIYYRKKKNLKIKAEQKRFALETEIQKLEELQKISKIELRAKKRIDTKNANLSELQIQLRKQQAESSIFLLDIQKNITADWKIIEKKMELFAFDTIDQKMVLTPELKAEIIDSISSIKKATDSKLYEWAKKSIQSLPNGNKIIAKINDTELLLLILCCNGYLDIEISSILNVNIRSVLPSRIELKKKLLDIPIPLDSCNEMIFP